MNVHLLGIGTACPAGKLSQAQALELNVSRSGFSGRRAALLERLYRRSTVRERASVLIDPDRGEQAYEELARYYPTATGDSGHGPTVADRMRRYEREALPLALDAVERALDTAGIEPTEVDQLVTVSCTGFAAPGVDTRLIARLGLPPTTGRTSIGFMGCHGAINGLRAASALAASEPGATVVLCAVELCTLHFHYGWGDGKAVANTLFADGSAAVVLRAVESDGPGWKLRATGSCLLQDSQSDMGWTIGNHGFEMTLSSRVPSIIRDQLAGWLDGWLEEKGYLRRDIASWAVHPGGPRVIDAVTGTLGLSDDDTAVSREVLADHGNMSSPTVLFILERLARHGAPRPCVTLAFGPGLVVEAALLV